MTSDYSDMITALDPAGKIRLLTGANTFSFPTPSSRQLTPHNMTVLKNDCDVLPLSRAHTVTLVGRHAVESIGIDSGSTRPTVATGLTELLGSHVTVIDGVDVSARLMRARESLIGHHTSRPTMDVIDDAVRAASTTDVAVIVVGLTEEQETDSIDNSTSELPGAQNEMVEAVAGAARRTVVVVNAAKPVLMPWLSRVDAVLWAGLPGQEGGRAVAAALLGDLEPARAALG